MFPALQQPWSLACMQPASQLLLQLVTNEPQAPGCVQEYKALVAAGVRVHSHASRAVGARGEGDLITRDNKIFLAANESITLPFKLQSFEPPDAYRGGSSAPADQRGHPSSPGAHAGAGARLHPQQELPPVPCTTMRILLAGQLSTSMPAGPGHAAETIPQAQSR
jgi:hypothetical protein